jgi:ATP-dependent Clp protease protease subunit
MTIRKMPEVRAFQQTDTLSWEPPETAIEAFDQSIRAADETDETVISIYGTIGYDPFSEIDNSERRIAAALRRIGKRDVTVNLNSPGGNFFSGLAVYNLLRAHPAKVTVNIVGMAGSAASVIAMAGDEILMADGSFIMVHKASALIMGNEYDAKDAAELLADVDRAMAEIYAARAGVKEEEAAAWMDRRRGDGTMFNAATAIDRGLADKKMASSAVKITAEAPKDIPAERVVERALMAASNKTRAEARNLITALKSGKPDAAAPAKPDAGDVSAVFRQMIQTLRS